MPFAGDGVMPESMAKSPAAPTIAIPCHQVDWFLSTKPFDRQMLAVATVRWAVRWNEAEAARNSKLGKVKLAQPTSQ